MKNLLLPILGVLVLNGCTDSIHTEEYYRTHLKEKSSKQKECKLLNKTTSAQYEECENAFMADRKHGEIIDSTKHSYKY